MKRQNPGRGNRKEERRHAKSQPSGLNVRAGGSKGLDPGSPRRHDKSGDRSGGKRGSLLGRNGSLTNLTILILLIVIIVIFVVLNN